MVKDQHSDAVKEASQGILPEWTSTFRALLSVDPVNDLHQSDWSGIVLRQETFKVDFHFAL
jgi:importin-9